MHIQLYKEKKIYNVNKEGNISMKVRKMSRNGFKV